MSVCEYACLTLCLSVCLSVCLRVCLTVCMSTRNFFGKREGCCQCNYFEGEGASPGVVILGGVAGCVYFEGRGGRANVTLWNLSRRNLLVAKNQIQNRSYYQVLELQKLSGKNQEGLSPLRVAETGQKTCFEKPVLELWKKPRRSPDLRLRFTIVDQRSTIVIDRRAQNDRRS
jgi:hypothetical protein